MKFINFIGLSCFLGVFTSVFGDNVKMVLYSELFHDKETSSYFIETSWPTPNQTCLREENRAVSYCAYGPGFWVGYEFPNYASEHVGWPYLVQGKNGEETCGNFPIQFRKNIGSYRFAGINNQAESITIFDDPKFQGSFRTDIQNPDISLIHFSSMLIVGPTPVILFQKINYEGLSYCVDPNNNNPPLTTPGAVFNIIEIDEGIKPGDVKSFRRGPCPSKKRSRGYTHKKYQKKQV